MTIFSIQAGPECSSGACHHSVVQPELIGSAGLPEEERKLPRLPRLQGLRTLFLLHSAQNTYQAQPRHGMEIDCISGGRYRDDRTGQPRLQTPPPLQIADQQHCPSFGFFGIFFTMNSCSEGV